MLGSGIESRNRGKASGSFATLTGCMNRRIRRVVFSGLMAVVALAAVGSASAYTTTQTGAPGVTTTPFTYGDWNYTTPSKITVPWRTAYKAPAYPNHDQYVCVKPRLWKAQSRSWVFASSSSSCGWIRGAAQSVNLNGIDFVDPVPYAAYSVDVVVTWQFSNGVTIGTRTYDYNAVNDYRCLDAYPHCSISDTGWGGASIMVDL